jgi:hypothetical protein
MEVLFCYDYSHYLEVELCFYLLIHILYMSGIYKSRPTQLIRPVNIFKPISVRREEEENLAFTGTRTPTPGSPCPVVSRCTDYATPAPIILRKTKLLDLSS